MKLNPPTLDSVHHVAIPCTDVVAAAEFFKTKFRVEILYQDATWALLGFANVRIALVVPEQRQLHIGLSLPLARIFEITKPASTISFKSHRDGSISTLIESPTDADIELMLDNTDLYAATNPTTS